MFSSRQDGGVHVITFARPDVLDAFHAERLGEGIYGQLAAVDAPKVVLDLHNVELLSSSALGVFISLNALVEDKGGKLCLANASESFRQILKMTKLESLVETHDTMVQAIESLGR